MGVLHGRDLLSRKYITAIIKDASKRLYFIPIKTMIGEYFLAEIDNQVYCFKLDNEICKYREKLTKSFEVVQYDIKHYRPIKSGIKELEMALQINSLPKADGMLADILRILGAKEKNKGEFTPHTLKNLIDELSKYNTDTTGKSVVPKDPRYTQQIESIINFLDNLRVDEITTPVRGVSDFIEDDLRATDPKFLGTVATTLQALDYENKKVTNIPVKSSLAWMKMGLVIMMIAMVGFVVYYGYTEGWFDTITDLTKGLEGFQGIPTPGAFQDVPKAGQKDSAYYQNNYTPESLRAAVDRGEIKVEDLPPDIVAMIKDIEPLEVTPVQP